MTNYIIKETQQKKNTAIAATASEVVISGTLATDFYNHLEVVNGDAVTIEVYLDGDLSRAYRIEAKTAMTLDASEGQKFMSVYQTNKDAATAETADKIIFKAFKKIEV